MAIHILSGSPSFCQEADQQPNALLYGNPYIVSVGLVHFMTHRTDSDLARLQQVTIVNLDLDTIRFPPNLKDSEFLIDPLIGTAQTQIPEDQQEAVIPPLPIVPDRNILREIHILLFAKLSAFTLGEAIHPELKAIDTLGVIQPVTEGEIKKILRSYLVSIVHPALQFCTRIVEGDQTLFILNKQEYLKTYEDGNSLLFMTQFIETSMFSVYFVRLCS